MKNLIDNDDFVDGFLTATTVITILLLLLFSIPVSAQLPASGSLSIKTAAGSGRSIAQEVDGNTTGNKSLTTLSLLAGKTEPHSMLEFYGYSSNPPGPVRNQTASSGGLAINVSWLAPNSGGTVSSYRVERQANFGAWVIMTSNTTSTSYQDFSITSGTTYTYRIRAQGPGGNSDWRETAPICYNGPCI